LALGIGAGGYRGQKGKTDYSMSSRVETQNSTFDIVKLVIALLILASAVVAFYYFSNESLLLRVLGLLAAAGIATAVALQTERGRTIRRFFKDAQIEVRKVVWPSRQETIQTTLIVMVVVIIVGVFLWLLDMFLTWGVQILTGQGA